MLFFKNIIICKMRLLFPNPIEIISMEKQKRKIAEELRPTVTPLSNSNTVYG